MTPAEAVATVQQLLSRPFPPDHFHEPARVAAFLAADGAVGGLLALCIRAQAPQGVLVEVTTAALPQQTFGYQFAVDDLLAYDADTLRAAWLLALVRAVERAQGIVPPAMEVV